MVKIFESEIIDGIDYNKYRRLIDDIANEIKSGANANLSRNIKKLFKDFGGEVRVTKISPRYITYDGYIFCDARGGRSTLSGSISLNDLKRDTNRLAEDIAYVQYLNDGGKDIGMSWFLDIVY